MRPTVALLHPYWAFWESSVPGDLRADRLLLLARAKAALEPTADVVVTELVAAHGDSDALGRRCAAVDAVVVVSTMAAPPSEVMAVLDVAARPAVVLWALTQDESLPDGAFTHSDITTRGATVGAPMIGSALTRAGRPFDVVLTSLERPDAAIDAVRRAGAAGRLKRSTLLKVGAPIPGYTSVDASDEALRAVGVTVVRYDPRELANLARQCPPPPSRTSWTRCAKSSTSTRPWRLKAWTALQGSRPRSDSSSWTAGPTPA